MGGEQDETAEGELEETGGLDVPLSPSPPPATARESKKMKERPTHLASQPVSYWVKVVLPLRSHRGEVAARSCRHRRLEAAGTRG